MRAVFLDRDGTLNKDADGYISEIKDFLLYDFTIEALRIFRELGFLTILVTNQSGIARGLTSIEQVEAIHEYMQNLLRKENVQLDMILYSPYHEKGNIPPYNIPHPSRKPSTGMYFEALHRFPIRSSQSYMIGDKAIDIQFGKASGLRSILVQTGYGAQLWHDKRHEWQVEPDFVVENLLSAAKLIRVVEGQKRVL